MGSGSRSVGRDIPDSTVARLPLYLRVLVDLAAAGERTVSSEALAEATGLTSAKVRKDLSNVGSYGTRGIGYDAASLIHEIRRVLGLTQHWAILIAGVGNLGRALAHYKGFAERGFRVAALVDVDPDKVGHRLDELEIRPVEELEALAAREEVAIGVIATPATGRAGRRRPDGGRRDPFDPELRSGGRGGRERRHRAQGGSGHRAADPRVLRPAERREPRGTGIVSRR